MASQTPLSRPNADIGSPRVGGEKLSSPVSPNDESTSPKPLPIAPVVRPQPLPGAPYNQSPFSIEVPPSSTTDLLSTILAAFRETGVDAQFNHAQPFQAECYKRGSASSSQFIAQAWKQASPGFLLELSRVRGDVEAFLKTAEGLRSRIAKGLGRMREDEGLGGGGSRSAGDAGPSIDATRTYSHKVPPIPPHSEDTALTGEQTLGSFSEILHGEANELAEEAAHAISRMAMDERCLGVLGEKARVAHMALMAEDAEEERAKAVGILRVLSALLKRVCENPGASVDSKSASSFSLSALSQHPSIAAVLGALHGCIRLLRVVAGVPAGEAASAALRREAMRTISLVISAQGPGCILEEHSTEWETLLMGLMDDPEQLIQESAFSLLSSLPRA